MRNGLTVFAIGLTCGVISGLSAGCTNRGSYEMVGAAASAKPASQGNKQTAAPAGASPLAGHWICDDSRCAPGEIKTISDKLLTIMTQSTVYFPKDKPQSVCRVQESDALSISNSSASKASGTLRNPQYVVLDSAENTHDCQDYYEKLNQSPSTAQPVTLALDASGPVTGAKTPELSINGVRYRAASDRILTAVIKSLEDKDSRDVSIAGTWNCADDSCNDVIVTISSDLSSITTYETLRESSGRQSCRIEEPAQLEITDSSDPDRLEGNISRQPPSLVVAVGNTGDCDDLVRSIGDQPSSDEEITLDRDGNQTLTVSGQRFIRSQENGASGS